MDINLFIENDQPLSLEFMPGDDIDLYMTSGNTLYNTDELAEGSTNLYYTDQRVLDVLTDGGYINDAANGVIKNGSTVELGGVLTKNTTISDPGNQYSLIFEGVDLVISKNSASSSPVLNMVRFEPGQSTGINSSLGVLGGSGSYFDGLNHTPLSNSASIAFQAVENFDPTAMGTKILFNTTPAGSNQLTTAMEILDDGSIKFNGYGSRDDGSTTSALYVDGNGKIKTGAINFPSSPVVNIGNSDLSLTGNRSLDLGAYSLSYKMGINTIEHTFSNGYKWFGNGAPIDRGFRLQVETSDIYVYGLRVGRGGGGLSSNISLGVDALKNNTTGDSNAACGYQSMFNNTTGRGCTAYGNSSVPRNTTGTFNNGFGCQALFNTTTGHFNLAGGYFTLGFNAGGSYNTSLGHYSLTAATSVPNTFNITAGGSGYVDGVYNNVPLTQTAGWTFGKFNAPTTVYVNITVSGGAVIAISYVSGGIRMNSNASFTISNAYLGGTGSGFICDMATMTNADYNTSVGAMTAQNFSIGSHNFFGGYNTANGLVYGSYNTILGSNVVLPSTLNNAVVIADGQGNQRITVDATGAVGIATGLTINASAIMELSSTSRGFLPPRMTADQASAIPSPAEGLMVYVTNTNGTFTAKGWWGWDGLTWNKLN